MVFKPINLARSVLSKTFPHGYAQSLVAASQSSSASHNTHLSNFSTVTNYFGKTGSSGHHTSQHVPHNNASGNGSKSEAAGADRGLDAYYAAWNKHHRVEDREWHQFQFAKRIGWKAPTTIPELQAFSQPQANSESEQQLKPEAKLVTTQPLSDRPAIHRAQSDSVVDDLKINAAAADAANTTTTEDAVVAIQSVQTTIAEAEQSAAVESSSTPAREPSSSPQTIETSSPIQSTLATSVSESDQYTDHLAFLAETQRHAEIPAVFESMLQNGHQPTPTAYNALLLAAIHLPKGKHQVVPKVLDVYSDMLRRRVSPDTATYAVLIEVLAARASDVRVMKHNLLQKRDRFSTSETQTRFMFASDETEYKILAEDDSLSLAIRLFDTSAAVTTNHAFPSETYRLLISACAEHGRIGDMVRIYGQMESQQMIPPTAIFVPMIEAFATTGDLKSSVECYEEYKSLALAHNNGTKIVARKDADVYAAVVKAYAMCEDLPGGLKFLGKIEESLQASNVLNATRDAVALQALVPIWISQQSYSQAMSHINQYVSVQARGPALEAICADAADHNELAVAQESFRLLMQIGAPLSIANAATALMAAHVRCNELDAVRVIWLQTKNHGLCIDRIESATMLANALAGTDAALFGLTGAREMFAGIRESATSLQHKSEIAERVEEAINVISHRVFELKPVASAAESLELLQMMFDNGSISNALAEHLLMPLGPNEIVSLSPPVLRILLQIQAGLISQRPQSNVAQVARFSHLVEIMTMQGVGLDVQASSVVEKALAMIQRPDLVAKWQNLQHPAPAPPMLSPIQYSSAFSPVTQAITTPTYDDSFDPYAASTDFKGSTIISEELEKTYGRHSAHLNEALAKFKNMRRVGRHPRYVIYAKLITAAAKENRLNLAHDILAMARQDVPLLPNSRVVTHGWVSILDAMVGACLTIGNREAAGQYHQDLLDMGAAPSANTFGLYITTLKDSAKTFDEATEAVKIFLQAKSEGIEPTSFLYNALIGKLGKARRIDDCLFYFAEMRGLGIRPTSVTYGTIVNALCRVSDDRFAEELFEEMESMPNYKPRPAPYNSLMQYFLTTKRDRSKVLSYYHRMRESKIEPTMHTYKLLIDTYATLEPTDMPAAEAVLLEIRQSGAQPEAVHYASLIHAKGCVMHDLAGARETFDRVIAEGRIPPQASLYQAIFESMVANHNVAGTELLLQQMSSQKVGMTPYIANTLIHGWALEKNVDKARNVYETLGREKREPSTYEAMTRAYLSVEDHGRAMGVVGEALRRGYPAAVANRICDLVGGGVRA